jgi:hypothetical protein
MANVKVTVDGKTIMDGDTGQWSTEPPAIIKEQLKANARPALWMQALLLTIADAAMADRSLDADIRTAPGEWTLAVRS